MTARDGLLAAAIAAALAGCGGDEARLRDLERRVAELEREREVLVQALRDAGIPYTATAAEEGSGPMHLVGSLELQARLLERASANRDAAAAQLAVAEIGALLERLEAHRQEALPLILAAARRAEGAPQSNLLEAFARLGGAAVCPQLESILDDRASSQRLRFQAARSLIELEPELGATRVARLLADEPDFPELYFLVFQLGESRAPGALPVLCTALAESRDPSVRCHAATALGNFPGDRAAEALAAAATGDPYPAVRVNALHALPKAAPARAAAVARDVLDGAPEPPVRDAAQRALSAAGKGNSR